MSLTVTYSAKVGDCLWALATVRRMAQLHKGRVNMVVSKYLAPLVPLLRAQPYIADAWHVEDWVVEFTAPATPVVPPNADRYEGAVFHLGMTSWPTPTIIEDHARRMAVSVDPWEPWITPIGNSGMSKAKPIGIAFTAEWFELKAGLVMALLKAFPEQQFYMLTYPEDRMAKEVTFPFRSLLPIYTGISGMSDWLSGCQLVVCCKSMARVMALGMGVPTVVVEPSTPRHNPVFDPPGASPREIIQNGFDAREMVQNVEIMLGRLS